MKTVPIHHVKAVFKVVFWFSLGAVLGLFFFVSFVFFMYQRSYKDVVYPGIYIKGTDFGGKTELEVKNHFTQKNNAVSDSQFTFSAQDQVATVSAREIEYGYDAPLLANQAYTLGRSGNLFSDLSILFQAYINGVQLEPSYTYDQQKLQSLLSPLKKAIDIPPVDALFTFQEGKVTAFRPSKDGREANTEIAIKTLNDRMKRILTLGQKEQIVILVPITVLPPDTTTNEANKLGIKELVASGTSLFKGSIPNRIYNITLAATRLNGILIPPGETFSFVKAVGDISKLTGYKEAYVISGGKTVLGDGGGVCQVSTTFFRAVLNAGFPVIERNPHAYRVSYYEQDEQPGIDAAIYTPTVDLKFKNDTTHHILVQTIVDPENMRLTFELYGTRDNREVTLTKPVITRQTPAPEPLYQDDPNLPKGQVKQIDFAAPGASVYFTRTVKKDNKVVTSDKFVSNYRPWQAVFLRGTKE